MAGTLQRAAISVMRVKFEILRGLTIVHICNLKFLLSVLCKQMLE
jgi:hypothetical protein